MIIDCPSKGHKNYYLTISKPLHHCITGMTSVVLQVDVSDREAVRKAALTTRTQMGEVCRSGILSLYVVYLNYSLFVNEICQIKIVINSFQNP